MVSVGQYKVTNVSITIPNPDPAQHRDMAQTGAGANMC